MYKSLIYLFENHEEFNIDPNNISICGTSAGGNLAAAVSMLCRETKKNIINSQILFENVRRYVVANADQTPERAMVHKTGHDGGDFLFFPK